MKPDRLGARHPMEYAIIDGLYPQRDMELQPVVEGTAGHSDDEIIWWLLDEPARAALTQQAIATLLLQGVFIPRPGIMRFLRCPECNEWAPCSWRKQRGY